jgi:hypothetical protein
MKKINTLEYATGFLMGLFLASFLEAAAFFVYTLITRKFGLQPAFLPWWFFIPLPILAGLVMGRIIASLHLEDY